MVDRQRVVIVGGGFAGLYAGKKLEKLLPASTAELVIVSPTDHLTYSPLLPDVTASVLEPRHVAVSLRQSLPRHRLVVGHVTSVDVEAKTITISRGESDADPQVMSYDRLLLAPGSVTRRFPIPGVAESARGVKTITEAAFVRDHLVNQLDAADSLPDDPRFDAERAERMTVVAVGAGYTGTEIVAQTQRWLKRVADRWSKIDVDDVKWLLIDVAPAVLPELGPRLGQYALSAMKARGIDVRLGVSVASVEGNVINLTDDTAVPSRTLIWNAGIVANPLMGTLGLPLERGRLVVDAQMKVTDDVWAVGDAAAVPDLAKEKPADGPQPVTPPTAQHAQRQGTAVGQNIAASFGIGQAKDYVHKDLGLVADLGGLTAVAKPLGVELTGLPAKIVARGYHLFALPSMANRVRVLTDWALHAVLPPQAVALNQTRSEDALISTAQNTEIYPKAEDKPKVG
ncbi:NAD(P)/FAD-dependent oxidoreductase [Paenibacillus sp. TRM 82003]|uniref:NAD(P)/FAD-dependent oxidoreductase n=1 Tax=Kineococcus sp. TRM81007 TaxID=2925831 RepID=UPI001F5AC896|nr:NAD(P)/FAD-dependent oxidoreductase [Kineococcus sp. TRM81007]MCI2238500.1 NAD(P)/FAD-dependent oxidoreductase [Kineococcus sp. TRM81007]MCI3921987.1 NAD(P)/FAD-dependent oxidoreductase [Paenibacillus sp. TRM 82003]